MKNDRWVDVGPVKELKKHKLRQIVIGKTSIALIHKDGEFTATSGECNHEKGPLGKGHLKGDYIYCPWHGWHYHRKTGHAEPPYYTACLPRHSVKEKGGRLFVNLRPENRRVQFPHPPHPLSRKVARRPGPIRMAGISATPMSKTLGRYSTSENLLETALNHAKSKLKAETKLIKLRELKFNHCGGFYSIDERACTWPCTFSQIDEKDQLSEVYEALVFWADVILIATPIRWGSASSLYYKMAERLNCIENQLALHDNRLLKNKVAAFIITGGQDNIQSVAGQMLSFFGQLGLFFPQEPYIGHSRGWAAEDMDNNIGYVKTHSELRTEAKHLAERAVTMSRLLLKDVV
ncbi:MAG: NAD(P)H-dependent oxidoreductase [Candidatus Omnitrophica bacterium]|nr:NAD(P)H-dependent oxidoreductase [Candidatus Omnitrophota bacterium]